MSDETDTFAWDTYETLPEEGKQAIYRGLRRRVFHHRRIAAAGWCVTLLQQVRLPSASLIAFGDAFKLEAHALRGYAPTPDREAFVRSTLVGDPTETMKLWSFREHLLVCAREMYRASRAVRAVGAEAGFSAFHAAARMLGDPKDTGYIPAPLNYEEVCVFLIEHYGDNHPLCIGAMGVSSLHEAEKVANARLDDLNPNGPTL